MEGAFDHVFIERDPRRTRANAIKLAAGANADIESPSDFFDVGFVWVSVSPGKMADEPPPSGSIPNMSDERA